MKIYEYMYNIVPAGSNVRQPFKCLCKRSMSVVYNKDYLIGMSYKTLNKAKSLGH